MKRPRQRDEYPCAMMRTYPDPAEWRLMAVSYGYDDVDIDEDDPEAELERRGVRRPVGGAQ